MLLRDIITELTFQGRPCTKDCSGHAAGYRYARSRNKLDPCDSSSPSFNDGCDIAATQMKVNKVVRPKVRGAGGRFVQNPRLR